MAKPPPSQGKGKRQKEKDGVNFFLLTFYYFLDQSLFHATIVVKNMAGTPQRGDRYQAE
jgi:hypothetical protein